jgi:hypothetical protein
MGCGASIPAWQADLVVDWPIYSLVRTQLPAGEHILELSAPGDGGALLGVKVVPFKNKHGHVSVQALHPYAVEFEVACPRRVLTVQLPPDARAGAEIGVTVDGVSHAVTIPDGVAPGETLEFEVPDGSAPAPTYHCKKHVLSGERVAYTRGVTSKRQGPSDTIWRAAPHGDAAAQPEASASSALPRSIFVQNGRGRVAVWEGRVAANAERGPGDLLASVDRASVGTVLPGNGTQRRFEVRVRPELSGALSSDADARALFLAIAVEGFWCKGANCFAASDQVNVQARSQSATGDDVRKGSPVQFFAPSRAQAIRAAKGLPRYNFMQR